MGRKNRRITHKPPLTAWVREPVPPPIRCCYCGKPLDRGEWHWMRDEFGQLVRKCNDERGCYRRRREVADEAYNNAVHGDYGKEMMIPDAEDM